MTSRDSKPCNSGSLVVLALLISLAGCASSTVDEPALQASGAIDSGQYPNLNIRRVPAAPQLTDEERDAKIAALKGAGAQQAPGGTAGGRSNEELARLGQTHGDDVLKEIAAQ